MLGGTTGSELRQPLGITIIGGLLVSQILTLITTPVVYLYLDRFRKRSPQERQLSRSRGPIPLGPNSLGPNPLGDAAAPPEPA